MPKPPKHPKAKHAEPITAAVPAVETPPATADSLLHAINVLRSELSEIAPRLQAETELRAAERRFAGLASGPIGLWHAGPDGSTEFVNQAMVELLAAESTDELHAHRLDELIDPTLLTPGTSHEVELTGPSRRRHAMISTVQVDGGAAGHLHAFVDVSSVRAATRPAPGPKDDPQVVERLRQAVAANELVLHYQPVLDMSRGLMIGCEALVRWNHPKRGLITAADFIGQADRAGLMPEISAWVIAEACRQSVEWRSENVLVGVSLNLPLILSDAEVLATLRTHVASTGLRPSEFMIEITESALLADPARAQNVLADLAREGFRLAIDDFGTGYSSLAQLRKMPVSLLKIDRSFITDLPADPDAGTVVRTIIQLAANLGLVALAEGIENEQQLTYLTTHGCHLGQGYLLSPAIPGESIPTLYRRYQRAAAGDV